MPGITRSIATTMKSGGGGFFIPIEAVHPLRSIMTRPYPLPPWGLSSTSNVGTIAPWSLCQTLPSRPAVSGPLGRRVILWP